MPHWCQRKKWESIITLEEAWSPHAHTHEHLPCCVGIGHLGTPERSRWSRRPPSLSTAHSNAQLTFTSSCLGHHTQRHRSHSRVETHTDPRYSTRGFEKTHMAHHLHLSPDTWALSDWIYSGTVLYVPHGDISCISLKSGCQNVWEPLKVAAAYSHDGVWPWCPLTTYRVRSQGDSAPAAGAELGLAVRTQIPTTVCKFGLAADAAGRCVIPVSGRARRHCGLPDHRLPVAGQLLLDASGWNRNMTALMGDHIFKADARKWQRDKNESS